MASFTYEDANTWRQGLIELLQERDHLARENAILKQQIQQLQSAGAQLTPELAKSWLPRFERCPAWSKLAMGDGSWDYGLNAPSGEGLKDLLADLKAVPTTVVDRALWDRHEDGKAAPRPAPTRKPDRSAMSWLLDQKHPGLGASFTALTKGLQGRLRLVIEAAFLLYGQEAVAKLTNEPEAVLHHLLEECHRAGEPANRRRTQEATRLYQELFKATIRSQLQQQARQALGVGADATAEEIKQAYRQLARQHHPDAGGDAERFHQIQEAYEALQQPAAVAV